MRLFTAIDLPRNIREELDGWLPDQPGVRKTNVDQLHLTTLFLGECPDEAVDEIVNRLNDISAATFRLIIRGTGAFPSRKQPRVIWAGVEAAPALMELQQKVEKKLSDFGNADRYPVYNPHITLGRMNPSRPFPHMEPSGKLTINVNRMVLKKSELHPAGSIHSVLEEFNLKAG